MPCLLDREFAADSAALGAIRAAVRDACREAGCSDALAADWVLAVNEACMNVIQHAYRSTPGQALRVVVGTEGGRLVTLVCDRGVPARLEDLQPRALEDIRPGGLGVHFIRQLTDTMAYLPPEDGWQNRLQLTKTLPAAATPDTGKEKSA